MAAKNDVKHLDMIGYMTPSLEQMMMVKSMQNPEIFHRDFIAGPMFRDYKVAIAMEQRAEWCFREQCKNNVYSPEHVASSMEKKAWRTA